MWRETPDVDINNVLMLLKQYFSPANAVVNPSKQAHLKFHLTAISYAGVTHLSIPAAAQHRWNLWCQSSGGCFKRGRLMSQEAAQRSCCHPQVDADRFPVTDLL